MTLLTGFTIHGRELRQTELNAAFHSSMENAMRQLLSETGGTQMEQEWKILFVDSLKSQIKSASDLEVRILYYTHPNGQAAQMSVSGTILLEEYVETKADHYFQTRGFLSGKADSNVWRRNSYPSGDRSDGS